MNTTFNPDQFQHVGSISELYENISAKTKTLVQKGIHPLWVHLGKAPSTAELSTHLEVSEESILDSFEELRSLGLGEAFYPDSNELKWFWPLSSVDHGIRVKLEGEKTVFARCAVDALGMSAMFGKSAEILVTTPLLKNEVKLRIDGDKFSNKNKDLIISFGKCCDDLLFFSSQEEFHKYKLSSGKDYLEESDLSTALERGVRIFGGLLGGSPQTAIDGKCNCT